jgi:hypothetical protein
MTRKPEGHDEMTKLLGKLVQVPKKELDAALAQDKPKPKKSATKRKK